MIENFGLKVAIRRVQGEVLIHSSLRASPYIVQVWAHVGVLFLPFLLFFFFFLPAPPSPVPGADTRSQLLAAFETRHEVILVMELCQGGTLLEYFRTRTRILRDAGSSQAGGLPEREVRGIFSQVRRPPLGLSLRRVSLLAGH